MTSQNNQDNKFFDFLPRANNDVQQPLTNTYQPPNNNSYQVSNVEQRPINSQIVTNTYRPLNNDYRPVNESPYQAFDTEPETRYATAAQNQQTTTDYGTQPVPVQSRIQSILGHLGGYSTSTLCGLGCCLIIVVMVFIMFFVVMYVLWQVYAIYKTYKTAKDIYLQVNTGNIDYGKLLRMAISNYFF